VAASSLTCVASTAITEQTYYREKAKDGGMGFSALQRLNRLRTKTGG
jgi:hypothetical protein